MIHIQETPGQCSIVSRPNNSLSAPGTVLLFLVIALFALAIALGFSLVGAWPVIIFTIFVLLGLSAGFQHVLQHAGDYERLTLSGDKLHVELSELGRLQQREMNACWVGIMAGYMPDGDCRWLALRSHGKEIVFGRHLTSEERLRVRHLLKTRLRQIRYPE